MKKYTIGVDFGTLSGRAVLIEVDTGNEVASAVLDYPHAVMDEYLILKDGAEGAIPLPKDFALQNPQDYLDVLSTTIPATLKQANVSPEDVIGVGIDFTSCTVMPIYKDGTPLCFNEKWRREKHAYVKLWKHHAAQAQANKLNAIAEQRGEEFLKRYGGKISSEWVVPKVWQILDEAPEVYAEMDKFIEAADWLVWQLTGEETRNSCTAGYKSIYNKRAGFPSKDFYKALDPRLENFVDEKLNIHKIMPQGAKAGEIDAKAAQLTGLKQGTPVAVANVDAHVAVPAVGITGPGKMLAIMGTSTCHMILDEKEQIVPGMCGVVEDGIIGGYMGYEAGQSCVGDHFQWFVENALPYSYKAEADARGINEHALLREKAESLKPGESGLVALDWWNGNRSVLVDVDLSGVIVGYTLRTKPEEVYRALIEATAFGTRMIIETFRESGVDVSEFFAAGGISQKDPFTMQIYADIINMEIKIAGSTQAVALGSAMFGALAAGSAAGGFDNIVDCAKVMSKVKDKTYKPNPENVKLYDKLYAEYKLLHDYFGRGGNDVMKRLK